MAGVLRGLHHEFRAGSGEVPGKIFGKVLCCKLAVLVGLPGT